MMQLCLSLCLTALTADQSSSQYLFEIAIYKVDAQGQKEVLSRPQLVTRHGQEALVSIGQQVPVIFDHSIKDGKTVYSVCEEQVGIIVKMTPSAHRAGEIKLKMDVSLSEVCKGESLFNTIYKQEIKTARVLPLEKKSTVMMGGSGVDGASTEKVFMEITPRQLRLSRP
jgi:type II secretory pathway component GspD/PulD (secretin)